jgi:hypothetical protein
MRTKIARKLKEYAGFKPGQTVYLRSDLNKRIPMTVKAIQVLSQADEFAGYDPSGERNDSEEIFEIVCLRATSQKNIVADFFPPEVICTEPKK